MAKLDSLEPDFKIIMEQILLKVSEATGLKWVVVSGRRTMQEQADIYAQGRTKPGRKVSNAQPGSSPHNYGLGCDCAPLKKGSKAIWWDAPTGYWDAYGAHCEDAGMEWGGHFRTITDLPHCEHPRWKAERAKYLKASHGG